MPSLRGNGLRDIEVFPERTSLFNVFGPKGLNPSVKSDALQLQAVLKGYASGSYTDEQMQRFLENNPAAKPFVGAVQQDRTRTEIGRKYFDPGSPAVTPFEGEFAGKGALLPKEAVAPKSDLQGAYIAAMNKGDVEFANSLLKGQDKNTGNEFEGPVLFDPEGNTYRSTKSGTIRRVKVEGDSKIAPPVYPFTTVDSNTGQLIQQVITKPEAARRAGSGSASLGPSSPLKPLPKEAQENFAAIPSVYRALDTMENSVKESGRISGIGAKVGAFFGTNEEAVKFETARNNLRVQAQAMIKGIPSNYDVQTFLLTIGDLLAPETVNKERIKFTRDVTDDLLKASIAYYKGTGYQVPRYMAGMAKRRGINLDDIGTWNGQDDPFEDVNKKYMNGNPTKKSVPDSNRSSREAAALKALRGK